MGVSGSGEVAKAFSHTTGAKVNSVAGVPIKIIDPADNLNGIELLLLSASQSSGAGVVYFSILAKSEAPVSMFDGDVIQTSDMYTAFTTVYSCGLSMDKNIRIDAGKGLYLFPDSLSTTIYSAMWRKL